MTNESLKFPSGTFTHTELAQFNGKERTKIWTEYQKAIKDGIIVCVGQRRNVSGKGKPAAVWKVADGQPVPIVDKVEVVKVEAPEPEPVVVEMDNTVIEPLPVVEPVVAPVVTETVEVVEVIQPAPMVRNLTCQVTEIDEVCPFCKTKLLSIETAGGVKVWCPVNDWKICSCSENPYGVGRNQKDAYEVLCDKFFKRHSAKA